MNRLLPPALFLIAVVTIVLLRWLIPLAPLLSFPASLLGIIPVAVGLGMAVGGSSKFARVGTNINTFRRPDVLVTDGIFRFSRNPMYLGFVIALAGIAIVLGNLLSIVVVLLFFVIVDRWYIPFEERAMLDTFGQQYRSYQSQTRRWL